MTRKPLAVVAVIVVAVLSVWLFLLRVPGPPAPQVLAPAVPSCTLDGGRPFTTLALTLCIPPEAAMTTKPSGDQVITTVAIPNIAEPLTIVSAPFLLPDKSDKVFGPPIMERIQEKPVIRNSLCREFRVVDAHWKRTDGWQAREITSIGMAAGYGWSPPSVAEVLDGVLDKTHCQSPGVANAR